MYSIVIPYLSNSKYIEQCKHYLQLNSTLPYELVEIVDETDVYYAFNSGVYKAKYDKVVLLKCPKGGIYLMLSIVRMIQWLLVT